MLQGPQALVGVGQDMEVLKQLNENICFIKIRFAIETIKQLTDTRGYSRHVPVSIFKTS